MRPSYLVLGVFGTLIFAIILAPSVLAIGNKSAKNMTAAGTGNSTASGMNNNATAAAGSNSTASNNVTAASGNNGHIYRGGAAAGSGGE